MSKEPSFSTPQDSQLFKGSQALLKSGRWQFDQLWTSLQENFSCEKYFLVICEILRPFLKTWTSDEIYFPGNRENLWQSSFSNHLCSSPWENFSCKNSFLVISEIFRPFLNKFSPDENYFLYIKENLPQLIQMKLSEKLKIYSGFCTAFLQSIFNLKLFKQKMSLIAYVFPKLQTAKYVRCLWKCLKSQFSVHPRTVNILNRPKHCCNIHDGSVIYTAVIYTILSPLCIILGKCQLQKVFVSNI